jgi:hypothetical protein
MSEGIRKLWSQTQDTLSSNPFRIPIFFSIESTENLELYNKLKEVAVSNRANLEKRWVPGKYQFVISSTDPVKLDSVELQTFFGLIIEGDSQNSDNPIIIVSTSYDSFSIAP